ncbi:TRAP-type mannitol/chloroaromatic compound transport system, substrate-binding protein [Thalassobaculum litoreum DSM 18839]|uniref:TRAP-type mannitol/chloroaromatic compound transport system, substrate-binding protein n=2 Tax=Thalassobaculaceae TaxID=2844864 RepID=A0A8G2ETZ4_9PROT|nr:TRAP-type mannitol/chloroaromatic compound transport system, substrate-binding protein [Thalassobaculum litoreum DSM 18839]
MSLNLLKKAGLVAAAAAFVLSAGAGDAEAKKVRWKMHSAFGTNVAVLGPVGVRITDWVNKISDGDFDIKLFEPGALAGGYAYYDPISQGAFDAAYGTPGANQGKNSAFAFLSTWPFGPGALEFNAWLQYGGGVEIGKELYARDGIEYFYCGMIPPETSGWFREPIESLDQLKGLKMRFFGVGAKVMQKLGVSTQQLAGGDIYPALELGTIDATEFSMPAIDRSYGFYQIAKYNYFPGWHQQSTTNEVLVNKANWEGLEDVKKAQFEVACKANIGVELAEGEALQPAAMIANQKDGVTNVTWSDDVLNTLREKWEEVLQEELAANPDVQKLWDSYTAFHEEYKVWGEMGYLK